MADKITVYDWTGEFRCPKKGEWFLNYHNQPQEKKVRKGEGAIPNYWILSPRQKGATKDE